MLTLALRSDILALLETAKAAQNERGGPPWSDSSVSKACFGHGEFAPNLRKWSGGQGGPTLEKTLKFERFLRDSIGDKAYQEFLKARANDFD